MTSIQAARALDIAFVYIHKNDTYILDTFLDIAFVYILEARNGDDKQDLKTRASRAEFYSARQFADSSCETVLSRCRHSALRLHFDDGSRTLAISKHFPRFPLSTMHR